MPGVDAANFPVKVWPEPGPPTNDKVWYPGDPAKAAPGRLVVADGLGQIEAETAPGAG